MATGNLEAQIPSIESGDEVGRLAKAFDHMKQSLKEHIEKLTQTTAIKERIESELNIARDIQMGISTENFPPFPDKRNSKYMHLLNQPEKWVEISMIFIM